MLRFFLGGAAPGRLDPDSFATAPKPSLASEEKRSWWTRRRTKPQAFAIVADRAFYRTPYTRAKIATTAPRAALQCRRAHSKIRQGSRGKQYVLVQRSDQLRRRRHQLPEQCPRSSHLRRRSSDLQVRARKVRGRAMGGSYGKEATVAQLPISKGLAGVSMRMEPGVMRELHWHATAAEWAFVTEGRAHDRHRPAAAPRPTISSRETSGIFRAATPMSSRPWAISPATSSSSSTTDTFPSSAPSASPTGSATRRRTCSRKISAFPASTFDSFPKAEVYFARGKIPPAVPAVPLQGWKAAAAHPQIQPPLAEAVRDLQGRIRMARGRLAVSDLDHHDRGGPRDGGGRATRTALASQRRRMAICSERRIQCDDVRLAAGDGARSPEPRRRRLHPAGLWPLDRDVGKEKARILIVFNSGHYQTIDLSQWIAGNPADILATNFAQDPAVFEISA